MPRWRVLSGKAVAGIFAEFGFQRYSQRGSHIKIRRTLPNGSAQSLTVPDHKELDRGTLHSIFRQASRFIPESELRPHFHVAEKP